MTISLYRCIFSFSDTVLEVTHSYITAEKKVLPSFLTDFILCPVSVVNGDLPGPVQCFTFPVEW